MRGSHIDRTIFGNIGIITPSAEGGYAGHIPEVPGCITQGETVEECRAMLKDALRGWVEVATEHRRDALDGQAALDEANNRITELEQDLVAQDVLIKEAKQSAERLEAELAAEKSRVAALAELIEEQGIISEKILRLAEATDKDSLGLKKFIEITSLETKDWLNGLGIVHDCGWREAILDRLNQQDRMLNKAIKKIANTDCIVYGKCPENYVEVGCEPCVRRWLESEVDNG